MLLRYIAKRILVAIPTLGVISFCIFMMIHLPPGNFLDARIQQMRQEGQVDWAEIDALRDRYHFDRPLVVRYFWWISGFVRGDWGKSFENDTEVTEILRDLLPPTIAISAFAICFTWLIAIPFGILAAVKKNTVWDYALTFLGLAAMATPPFVIAIIFQVAMQSMWKGFDPTGLISPSFAGQSWSVAKFVDLLKHIWVPIVILGVGGTAGMIRILRANVIDELRKQYVLCAKARGLHPALVVLRYPVRVAINPLISSVGHILPALISGSIIIDYALGLPTVGPTLLQALFSQDSYLAADIIFFQCILAVAGILLSDILLTLVDPRIKFEGR